MTKKVTKDEEILEMYEYVIKSVVEWLLTQPLEQRELIINDENDELPF